MSILRPELRAEIRNKIAGWPLGVTTLSAQLLAAATSGTLADGTGLAELALLEIESETIQVQSFTAGSGTLTALRRGWKDTTAAIHANGTAVKIWPSWGWTDSELNRRINRAIAWMNEGMVWTLVPQENTFASGNKEFGAPAGAVYPYGNIIKKIEYLQSDGTYKEFLGWKHLGDRIKLNGKLEEDMDVRIWVQKQQAALTSDAVAIDQDKAAECIELYTAGRCLEDFAGPRSRYQEYSASLDDRASSLDELQRNSFALINQATVLRDAISRPGLSGYAAVQKA